MKHILYANNDFNAVQDALNAGTLEKPYIAAIEFYGGIEIDYNTLEQQSCAQRGLCGGDPTDCHECTCEEQYTDPAAICDCEGGYYWGDECHDEPEPVDPCEDPNRQEECECVQQGGSWVGSECVMSSDDPCDGDPECTCNQDSGYNWWDGGTCHNCYDEWEELGYSSPEDCACDKRGEDSGVCPACPGTEQDEADCNDRGGTWDLGMCMCIEPEPVDPCEGYESQEECDCVQQGGTWSGSECQMPSD